MKDQQFLVLAVGTMIVLAKLSTGWVGTFLAVMATLLLVVAVWLEWYDHRAAKVRRGGRLA